MLEDCEWYGHDAAVLIDHRKKFPLESVPWHLTECPRLLEQDITDGQHNKMIPSMLHYSRPEYLAFDIDVFRGHLYQIIKQRERVGSNIKFGKKKFRMAADSDPAEATMPMVDAYNEVGPKPKRKKKVDPVRETKKRMKSGEIANLPDKRKGKVTRK